MPKLQQEPGQVGSIKEPYVRLVVSETVLQKAHGEFNVCDTSTRPRIIARLVIAVRFEVLLCAEQTEQDPYSAIC